MTGLFHHTHTHTHTHTPSLNQLTKSLSSLPLTLLHSLFSSPHPRKYADIGNTVQLQYKRPDAHMIEGWAELVTCHALPGEGVVRGLMGVAPSGSGCVLVCEMSSKGALTSEEYTKGMELPFHSTRYEHTQWRNILISLSFFFSHQLPWRWQNRTIALWLGWCAGTTCLTSLTSST